MNIFSVAEHCANIYAAIEFLRSRCVLRREIPRCIECDRLMTEVKSGRGEDLQWRCPSHKAQKLSLRIGSFLHGKNMTPPNFTMLAYLWSYEVPVMTTAEMMTLCTRTTVTWYGYLRAVCSDHFANNPVKIGGSGHIVQIGEFESMASRKRKNVYDDEDCVASERWVFAGLDMTTNLGFVVFAPDRTLSTLLPLIEKFILPGTTIHSNERDVYSNGRIGQIPVDPPFVHKTVDHEIAAVKRMWGTCKAKFTNMSGVHSSKLPSHLDEFMWRQRYGLTHNEAFDNILLHISKLYVTP